MVHKTCARCNRSLGDVHGNTKYCRKCRVEIRREQSQAKQQRYRDRKKGGTLINGDARYQIGNATSAEKILAELPPAQQDVLHLLRGIHGRLIETADRLNRIEINQDEFRYMLEQDPEFQRRYQWRERGVRKAMELLQDYEKVLALYKIRRLVEDILKTDKRTAEAILKQAQERIRRERERDQRQLDDFEGGEG